MWIFILYNRVRIDSKNMSRKNERKKKMRKVIGLIVCLVMIFALVAACSDGGGGSSSGSGLIKVGIINNPPEESGYRAANVADMEAVFTEANGYEPQFFYSQTNDAQLNAARGFITEGVDYLLLSAADTDGWEAVLRDAKEADIGVFLFDRMINVPKDLFKAAVISDMANQGDLAMSWLNGLGRDDLKVVHIQGQMGSDAQRGRTGAFDREVAAGNMVKVLQQTASWSEDEAKSIVQSVINSGEEFNVIYAENDGMAAGAVAALQEAGITHGVGGDVIIIGVDANRWALREVLAGNWNLNVQCSPFQAQVIHEMIQGTRAIPADQIIISEERYFEAGVITQADIDKFGLGD